VWTESFVPGWGQGSVFEDMVTKLYVYEAGNSLASWVAIRFQERLCSICLFELMLRLLSAMRFVANGRVV
jgi:hypothetical protein